MMTRVELAELPNDFRLIQDEQIELAFGTTGKYAGSEHLILTNKRIIIQESKSLPCEVIPYSTITRYTLDSSGNLVLHGIDSGRFATTNIIKKLSKQNVLDVEYLIASKICK